MPCWEGPGSWATDTDSWGLGPPLVTSWGPRHLLGQGGCLSQSPHAWMAVSPFQMVERLHPRFLCTANGSLDHGHVFLKVPKSPLRAQVKPQIWRSP